MTRDSEGFEYPVVDGESCVHCNLCDTVCPITHTQTVSSSTAAYAAVNHDEHIRLASSSGGVFSVLASRLLSEGGVVFGATFSTNLHSVHHIAVENAEDLCRLRGSKYLQSKIGDAYRDAKTFLEHNRPVLFSGTPCQIAGLKAYLGKNYDNLITQDLICHGVPSPMVWDKYLTAREKKAQSPAEHVTFRSKDKSWNSYEFRIGFQNNKEYIVPFYNDLYMKGFLGDFFLRPSCYACSHKGIERVSDITLADFWGVEQVLPQMADDKGVSLVLVHSKKGEKLLESMRNQLTILQVETEHAIASNPSALKSPTIPPKREEFMYDLQHMETIAVLKKHTAVKWQKKAGEFVRRILQGLVRRIKPS